MDTEILIWNTESGAGATATPSPGHVCSYTLLLSVSGVTESDTTEAT